MEAGDIYSEIGRHDDDTEQLIKPSQVKSRRHVYAGKSSRIREING